MRIVLYIFCLLAAQQSFAQEVVLDVLSGNAIQGGTIEVSDQYKQNILFNNRPFPFHIQSGKVIARLYFDESLYNLYNYYATEWKVKVTYDLELWEESSNAYSSPQPKSLEIFFDPENPYQDVSLEVFDSQKYIGARVTNDSTLVTNRSGTQLTILTNPFGASFLNFISDDIHFELALETERIYTLDVNKEPTMNSVFYDVSKREFTISWDYLHGAQSYDLEWLFVDYGTKPASTNLEVDFRNAVRVNTTRTHYTISNAFPRGMLLFRVRGIGVKESVAGSDIFDKRVEGRWSHTATHSNDTGTAYAWIDGLTPLEPQRNWQYQAVFAENGKRKEVLQFYDDALKPDQTVTILNTDDFAVVNQNVYDFLGRNSLQVIPAPQKSKGLQYYNHLHYAGNEEYSFLHFDTDSRIEDGSQRALRQTGNLGAGYYFSSNNNNPLGINGAFVPDANGYPFVRTYYRNDGSGRVSKITGMGPAYHTGTERHETRFLYSKPTQELLCKLFGNNVGFAKYYEQTIVSDPNGVASVVVKDLSGRVILTGLVGDEPDNLLPLDSKPVSFDYITTDLTRNNQLTVDNDALVINEVFTSVGSQRFDFSYELAASIFNNCGTSNPCVYDLKIYVLDEYGAKQKITHQTNSGDVDVYEIALNNITKVSSPNIINFYQTFPTGTYQVVKELTLNEAAVNSAVEDWKDDQTCYEPEPFIPVENCFDTCEDLCLNEYLSPLNASGYRYYQTADGNFIAKADKDGNVITFLNGYSQSDLNPLLNSIQDCKNECEDALQPEPNITPCELNLSILKADMSPGGQYFDNLPEMYISPGDTTLNASYDKNGWLNTNIDQATKNRLKECLADVPYTSENELWDDLRANWDDSYADILVALHPEYCAYKTQCCAEPCVEVTLEQYSNNCTASNTTCELDINGAIVSSDSCKQLTQQNLDDIDGILSTIDFVQYAADARQALLDDGITDPILLAEVSATKLKESAQKYLEEYYIYQRTKEICCVFPLMSPDSSTFTANGFQIRYPENIVFEQFDPCNPEDFEDTFKDNNCEPIAEQKAQEFVDRLDQKCPALNQVQLAQVKQKYKDEYLDNCENGTPVNIQDVIDEVANCGGSLPTACILEALPDDGKEETCECKKINQFVYDAYIGAYSNPVPPPVPAYIDVLATPGIENHSAVQDALDDVITDPSQAALKNDFPAWFQSCNDETKMSWHDPATPPPYVLPDYFSCVEEEPPSQDELEADCVREMNELQQAVIDANFQNLLDQKAEVFRSEYIANCLGLAVAKERMSMTTLFNYYHFTLYYYDQAGNLVNTVPPEGLFQKDTSGTVVHNSILENAELDAALAYVDDPSTNSFIHPRHLMITNYQYNSLDNVRVQNTPDGGKSEFFYDALGRLVVSQNAEQVGRDAYSYLSRDVLGRTTESGELISTIPITKGIAEDRDDFNVPVAAGGTNQLLNWVTAGNKTEVVRSHYDEANTTWVNASHPVFNQQENLRNRIASIGYDNNGDGTFDALTHYTYDAIGNVPTLWQENKDIPIVAQQVKSFDYDFDLISGNVNSMTYQKDQEDQFIHRYTYDADNRITKVETSMDGRIFDTDARYFYYAHGPLARIELGEKQVQGIDYIYNINGWIKGNNASVANAQFDAGQDGVMGGLNQHFAKDAYGFSLHYFEGDYAPINSTVANPIGSNFNAIPFADSRDLFNGNIARMVTSLKDTLNQPLPVFANAYRYDVLNRIKQYKPYWDNTANNPRLTNDFAGVANHGEYYNTAYKFGGNGNILELDRNSIRANVAMDSMDYNYKEVGVQVTDPISARTITQANARVNNQLFHVDDPVDDNDYDMDIDNQIPNNYKYDQIGRLVSDDQEQLTINWNVTNKVTSVIQTDQNPDVFFGYGPMGYRISKEIIPKPGATPPSSPSTIFYIRDAQGNPIATYKLQNGDWILQDFVLYGSKRLGTLNLHKILVP